MTVKQLIQSLQERDPYATVIVWDTQYKLYRPIKRLFSTTACKLMSDLYVTPEIACNPKSSTWHFDTNVVNIDYKDIP